MNSTKSKSKTASTTAALFTVAALAATCKPGKPTKANGKAAPAADPKAEKDAGDTGTPEAGTPSVDKAAPKAPKLKFQKEVLKVADLVLSAKFQPRAAIDKEAVNDYAELYKAAKEKGADSPLPPVKVIRRNGENIVVSGFHRSNGLRKAEIEETIADVAVNDTITDGEIFRLGIDENAKNGVRLTNADKLHNLHKIVKFPEFSDLSNNALTAVVGASEFFIRKHRPVTTNGATRTSKSGKKINTKNIGKKGGKGGGAAKPGAAAATAANNLAGNQQQSAENSAIDAALGGGAGTPSVPTLDEDSQRAVERIAGLLDGYQGFTAQGVRDGITQGTIQLTAGDLKEFANNSDDRVRKIAPLVINKGWTPKKANKEIDQTVDSTTKVAGLINLAISAGGATKRNSICYGYTVEDNSDYEVIVVDKRLFQVTVTPITAK